MKVAFPKAFVAKSKQARMSSFFGFSLNLLIHTTL